MKTKRIVITIAFTLLMLGLKAQTEYVYASIIYRPGLGGASKYSISVSKEGKYEVFDGTVSDGVPSINTNPVMELLNKMSKEGWDVFNSNVNVPGAGYPIYYFFLRKKEKLKIMLAKKFLITVVFALLMLGLKAQDKYEYATVVYNTDYSNKVFVSIGSENKIIDAGDKPKELFRGQNLTNVLGVIDKMAKEGWEVYANNSVVISNGFAINIFYFLKRKLN